MSPLFPFELRRRARAKRVFSFAFSARRTTHLKSINQWKIAAGIPQPCIVVPTPARVDASGICGCRILRSV